jgi:hypothetical protein
MAQKILPKAKKEKIKAHSPATDATTPLAQQSKADITLSLSVLYSLHMPSCSLHVAIIIIIRYLEDRPMI